MTAKVSESRGHGGTFALSALPGVDLLGIVDVNAPRCHAGGGGGVSSVSLSFAPRNESEGCADVAMLWPLPAYERDGAYDKQ